jgi:hypothetical protein
LDRAFVQTIENVADGGGFIRLRFACLNKRLRQSQSDATSMGQKGPPPKIDDMQKRLANLVRSLWERRNYSEQLFTHNVVAL